MRCFDGLDFGLGRVYRTNDVDEARELCGRIFNPHQLTPKSHSATFGASMDHLPFGPLSLNRLRWDTAVEVDPDRLGNYYLISVPVRGTARFQVGSHSVDVSTRCAAVISASPRFRFETGGLLDAVVIRLEAHAVRDAWAGLTGQAPATPLELAPALPVGGPAWSALVPIFRLLARSLATGPAAAGRQIAAAHLPARLQDMLLTTLLLHQSPQFLGATTTRAPHSAALIRRAEDYLMQNLRTPVTLTAAARACGVSARSLQGVFHDTHGCGPMQWLRSARLDAVHTALRDADAPVQITATALAHGFTHLGEFSQLYRQRFGETPTATLRRGR